MDTRTVLYQARWSMSRHNSPYISIFLLWILEHHPSNAQDSDLSLDNIYIMACKCFDRKVEKIIPLELFELKSEPNTVSLDIIWRGFVIVTISIELLRSSGINSLELT